VVQVLWWLEHAQVNFALQMSDCIPLKLCLSIGLMSPATGSGGTSVPLAAGMSGRAYLVTTQAPPTSSVIPVAKVLPQPVSAAPGGQGPSSIKAVDLSTTSVSSASETHSGVSSNISTAGLYLHAPGRPTAGKSFTIQLRRASVFMPPIIYSTW
jgi:hypothetical protein